MDVVRLATTTLDTLLRQAEELLAPKLTSAERVCEVRTLAETLARCRVILLRDGTLCAMMGIAGRSPGSAISSGCQSPLLGPWPGRSTGALCCVCERRGPPASSLRSMATTEACDLVLALAVQHIAPSFTRGLATWLDQSTPLAEHVLAPAQIVAMVRDLTGERGRWRIPS